MIMIETKFGVIPLEDFLDIVSVQPDSYGGYIEGCFIDTGENPE